MPKIQVRRDTLANWTSNASQVLADGEIGYVTDTKKQKMGDGVTTWALLPYTIDAVETFTNKTINLTSNTLVATLTQLNSAVSDADICASTGNGGGAFAVGALTATGGNANQLKLDNTGQQYTELDFKNNGATKTSFYYDNTNSFFYIGTSATQPLCLQSAGNVLIGSTVASTGAKLEVTGSLSAFDTTIANGASATTLTIGGGSNWSRTIIKANSSQSSWQISNSSFNSSELEFTPSTAVGGTTFTTPIMRVSSTGLAVTGSISATTEVYSLLRTISSSPANNYTGTAGQIIVDANYIYICTATNTWKRVALTTY